MVKQHLHIHPEAPRVTVNAQRGTLQTHAARLSGLVGDLEPCNSRGFQNPLDLCKTSLEFCNVLQYVQTDDQVRATIGKR